MRTSIRSRPAAAAAGAALLVAALTYACGETPTAVLAPGAPELAMGTGADPSLVCSPVTEAALVADNGGEVVGVVRVGNDQSRVFVTYQTADGWALDRTHLFVGAPGDEIPTSGGGNVIPGQFPEKQRHPGGATSYTYAVDRSALGDPARVRIAAHAEVLLGDRKEGAWGAGDPISEGGSWGTFFEVDLASCLTSLATPETELVMQLGGLTFSAPPGAVDQEILITVTPVLTSSLGTSAAPTAVDATADPATSSLVSSLDDVIPIGDVAWDFGPDGLQFSIPATITLSYAGAQLPPEIDEEDLRVYVINGVFEELPSTVDTGAKTVTASVEHFSTFFIGTPEIRLADLEVSQLNAPASPAKVNARLEYGADVRNLGPDAVDGATLVWEAYGDVVLDGVFGFCTEIASPIFATVAIECPVDPLAANGVDGIPVFRIVPQSTGTVEVWATVGSPQGAVDLNGDNDRRTAVTTIEAELVADLATTRLVEPAEPGRVGSALDYSADVQNLGPDPVPGATFTWTAFGDVTLGGNFGLCVEVANPLIGDVVLQCEVASMDAGTGQGIPTFRLIPQSMGTVEVWGTVGLPPGGVDPDGENNRLTATTEVSLAAEDGDYSIQSLTESGDPVKAQRSLRYTGVVALENGSTTPVAGARYRLVVQGSVELESDNGAGCTAASFSLPTRTEITCPVSGLTTGNTATFEIDVLPQRAPETLTATATVTPPPGVDDTNPGNEQLQETTSVEPLSANLFLTLIDDTPDPVATGELVQYAFYALSNGTGDDMPRVVVQFRVQADAELVSLPDGLGVTCTDLSAAVLEAVVVNCDIEPLQAGIASPQLVFQVRATGGTSLEAEGEIFPVAAYAVDPDLSDNLQAESTSVTPAPSSAVAYVSSSGANQVAVVEVATGSLVTTIPVGTTPRGMRLRPNTDELWVLNRNSENVSIISTTTNAVVATIPMQQLLRGDLFDLDFKPDGSRAYVTVNESGGNQRVTVIDAASRTVLTNMFLDAELPRSIRVTPDGSRAYVLASGAVVVLDLATHTVSTSIPFTGNGAGLVVTADGSTAYFTQQETSTTGLLREIDTGTNALVGAGIPVTIAPRGLVLGSAETHAYIADDRGRVLFLDLATGAYTSVATGIGTAPYEIAITPDDATLLVGYTDSGELGRIDVATQAAVGATAVGSSPGAVVVKP